MHTRLTRRSLLATGTAGLVGATAGCSGSGGESDDAPDDGDEPDPDLRVDDRFLSPAFPIEFVEPDFEESTGFAGDARIAYVHWHGADSSHWHQSPLELVAGEPRVGRTRFLIEGADAIPLGPDESFSQSVGPTEETPLGLLTATVDGDRVELTASEPGDGALSFELRADGQRRWKSPPLPVEIS